ncbi:TPA: hypothetical protein QEL67_000346 [Stenotrophomonas maltophilia]|nr:hypothetical protein [Stenotrophomonas maltophilia]HDS1657211.1 hypothetical protein [Stenotrophomonas maltophilia]HDS1671229.1 hypothetical protein [Stenotrophomonas maltophilia]
MLIGYEQIAMNVALLEGSIFNAGALTDGRPSSVCRLRNAGGTCQLSCTLLAAAPVRIVSLLGLSCPPGTVVSVTGVDAQAEPIALGGNAAGQPAVALADGSVAAWFVLDEDLILSGVTIQLQTDQVDVGELIITPAVETPIEPQWSTERVDPSVAERTLGAGLNVVKRRTYQRLRVAFRRADLMEARAQGLANGMDWDALAARVSGSARVAVIPRWQRAGGALHTSEIHRTAVYGQAAPGAINHLGGDYYGTAWVFEEVPPL